MRYTHAEVLAYGEDEHLLLTVWRDDENLPRFTLLHGGEGLLGEKVLLEDGNWGAALVVFTRLGGFASEVVLRSALRNYDAGRPGGGEKPDATNG